MPVSQWAASCVHRASGFWPLGPWLIEDWMTFRLIVDATAPRPQRAGAIRATSPSVPASGNKPPDSATWTMVTPTRIGMVWSPLVTSVEIARPISMDVTDSTASATKISISAVPGITTPLDGTFCPGQADERDQRRLHHGDQAEHDDLREAGRRWPTGPPSVLARRCRVP